MDKKENKRKETSELLYHTQCECLCMYSSFKLDKLCAVCGLTIGRDKYNLICVDHISYTAYIFFYT